MSEVLCLNELQKNRFKARAGGPAANLAQGGRACGNVSLRRTISGVVILIDSLWKMSYQIDPGNDLAEEIRRIAAEQILQAGEDLTDRSLERHERIHQARKRFKRIRSLMRLARGPLGDVRDSENVFFRDLGRDLADVRDAQVGLETFDDLMERCGATLHSRDMRSIRRALVRHRKLVIRKANVRTRIEEICTRLESAPNRLAAWPLDGDDFELLKYGLRNTYRRGKNRMNDAATGRTTEAVHEWRKRVKDIWYHMQLFERLWPEVVGYASSLADLSSILGSHHDYDILRKTLDQLEDIGQMQRDVVDELSRQAEDALLSRGLELGAEIYSDEVDSFMERMSPFGLIWTAARNAALHRH